MGEGVRGGSMYVWVGVGMGVGMDVCACVQLRATWYHLLMHLCVIEVLHEV